MTLAKTRWRAIALVAGMHLMVIVRADAAVATFTPVGATTVDAGTPLEFVLSVWVESLGGFNTADIIIGAPGSANVSFAYGSAWLSAFSTVTTPTEDVGFYSQDVFVGGNNATSVGAGLVVGLVTIDTTGMFGGTYTLKVDAALDGFSTLGLDGTPEMLNGSISFDVIGTCFPASSAMVEIGLDAGGASVPNVKNRMLSIAAADVGRSQAIRVTFVDLPAPYQGWNGSQLWVAPPVATSENSGLVDPIPGFGEFQRASLQCDSTGAFLDWGALGTVHIYHEGILPGGIYDVEVVDASCDPAAPASYSSPLTIVNARWGDVVGPFDAGSGSWRTVDNSIDVASDVVSLLDKFSNAPTAPSKTLADLEPKQLDFKINITDVTVVLGAFSGTAYPFTPSGPSPCP